MPSSKVERLWDDDQDLKNLKYINLSGSTQLKNIPNLSTAKKLQELILNGCTSLENIDSVRYLSELVNLDLSNCDGLSIVPDGIQSRLISFRGCSMLFLAPKISCKVEKLDLSGTSIKESPLIEHPSRLVRLDLSHCSKLESLSSSTCECKHLQYLSLHDCPKLSIVPDGIRSRYLSFRGCSNLMMAPQISCEVVDLDLSGTAIKESPFIECPSRMISVKFQGCSKLESLSSSICDRKLLKYLDVSACPKLKWLPDDLGNLEELEILEIPVSNLIQLHPTKLSKLRALCLSQLMGQEQLNWSRISLSGFTSLTYLKLANCGITMLPDDLGQLYSLISLDLSGNNFERMPAMNNLSNLKYLDISFCASLTSLSELPRHVSVVANNCSSLKSISNLLFIFSSWSWCHKVSFANCFKLNLSEMLLKESRRTICSAVIYPGNEIPNWFSLRNEGSSITLNRPPNCYKRIIGHIMSVVMAFPERYYVKDGFQVACLSLIKTGDGKFEARESASYAWFGSHAMHEFYVGSDHVLLGFDCSDRPVDIGYLKDEVEEMGNNKMLIKFSAGNIEVKQCGIQFLFALESKDKPYCSSRCKASFLGL